MLQGNILGSLGSKLTSLNVQHEITTANVLHDEIHSRLCLETGVQIKQEGMPLLISNQEYSLFGPRALHFVIFYDKLLFQNLDSI